MSSTLLKSAFCLSAMCMLAALANADDVRYVSDKLYVPLRSEQGDTAPTLNSGMPSGTPLKLIKEDSSSGYSLVEMRNGTQGWVRNRYLTKEPTAAMKLIDIEKKLSDSTSKGEAGLLNDLGVLKEENKKLNDQNIALERQFDELKQASGNVLKITQQNKEVIEKNQLLQSRVNSLEAIKEKTQDNSQMDFFVYGGLLVIMTLVISAVIDGIKRRRSYSSWS